MSANLSALKLGIISMDFEANNRAKVKAMAIIDNVECSECGLSLK